jgi:hypothetical protein
MAHSVSIPGGNGHPLVFNVSGSSLTNVFATIAETLTADRMAGTLTFNNLNDGTSTTPGPIAQAISPRDTTGATLNTIGSGGNGSATPNVFTLTTGAEYTVVDTGVATTVNGSTAGSDTVFGGANYTYTANGGLNDILFVSGDNTYNGSSVSGDTVSMGTGHDTVNTGAGSTTVFGGVGDGLINLNDSTNGSGTVFLGSGGHIVVNADGYADAITTATPGNTIYGGTSTADGSQLLVSITDTVGGLGGNDQVIAGNATTTVFDSVGGNSIFGGSGPLFFVGDSAASAISDSIVGGTGGTLVFGSTNDNLVMSSASTGGVLFAIAGGGNETLNGANAAGSFVFYGLTDTVNGSSESTSVVGGTGTNFFNTGSGNEAIVGGTGTNLFTLNEGGAGTHITIFDFASGNDSVAFGTAADSVSLSTGTVSDGNLTITLADNTTVEFIGVTSLSGHTI